MAWFNGDSTVNPGAAQVLVDTGPLFTGEFDVVVAVNISVQAILSFELRDAANTTTLKSISLRVATANFKDKYEAIGIGNGQRLRLTAGAGFTGTVEADMFVSPRTTTQMFRTPT